MENSWQLKIGVVLFFFAAMLLIILPNEHRFWLIAICIALGGFTVVVELLFSVFKWIWQKVSEIFSETY